MSDLCPLCESSGTAKLYCADDLGFVDYSDYELVPCPEGCPVVEECDLEAEVA